MGQRRLGKAILGGRPRFFFKALQKSRARKCFKSNYGQAGARIEAVPETAITGSASATGCNLAPP